MLYSFWSVVTEVCIWKVKASLLLQSQTKTDFDGCNKFLCYCFFKFGEHDHALNRCSLKSGENRGEKVAHFFKFINLFLSSQWRRLLPKTWSHSTHRNTRMQSENWPSALLQVSWNWNFVIFQDDEKLKSNLSCFASWNRDFIVATWSLTFVFCLTVSLKFNYWLFSSFFKNIHHFSNCHRQLKFNSFVLQQKKAGSWMAWLITTHTQTPIGSSKFLLKFRCPTTFTFSTSSRSVYKSQINCKSALPSHCSVR